MLTREELDWFSEELKEHSGLKIENKIIHENTQYLIGLYYNDFFSFGMSDENFFLKGYGMCFQNFVELTELITNFLGEEPFEFVEIREKEFLYNWPNINQKKYIKELKQVNEWRKNEILKRTFITHETVSRTLKKVYH